MPELSKDPVGDAIARAFSLREGPLDHVVDNQNLQQALLYGPVMYKSALQESHKFLSMSTHPPPVDDPVALLRAASFLPVVQESDHEVPHLEQPSVGGYPTYGLHNYQPIQVDVPEIEECSTWMTDVLDDFPAIGAQESSPLVSVASASFDEIPPSHYAYSTNVSISITGPQNPADDSSASPPSPTTPKTYKTRGFSSARAPILNGVASLAPTSKSLLPRGSRRCQRASEKLAKKVANMEQFEHVKRERQRRDDMSSKMATLECLLPPAGPGLKVLKKTFSELKLKKSTRSAPLKADHVNKINPDAATCASMPQLVEYHIQVDGEGGSSARLEKCRCRPDYMSSAMKVLERLDLDVCRCTITKMFDYTICVIIAKPRLTSSQVATSVSVVTALRSCVEVF